MSEQPILDALQTLAAEHPERAEEILTNLKAKWDSLSDDQKAQVAGRLAEVRDQAASMTPEQKQQIADQILSLG